MPLARVALYQKGITIYISPNTNDNPEWQATIRHIAIEGMCFFVNAGMVIRRSSYPSDLHEGDVASRFPMAAYVAPCIARSNWGEGEFGRYYEKCRGAACGTTRRSRQSPAGA